MNVLGMTIEKANINDHYALTEITKRSKAYWGYSEQQLALWTEQLTITQDYIETNHLYKLVIEHTIAGYYSFFYEKENLIKLDNLFILPDFIGKGFGKMLMNDFLTRAKLTGIQKIILDSEPKTEKFYLNFGFETIGQLETSIKDRYLPVMELNLSPTQKTNMYQFKRTDSSNADFQRLVAELDKDLAIRDGDEHAFFAQFNKTDTIKHVVMASENEIPVGCGALKEYEPGIMEIKRMFVLPEQRGKGIASLVLSELEQWAKELNYSKCILETGYKQFEAVALYKKCRYTVIPNYGQYAGVESSVCFEKSLLF